MTRSWNHTSLHDIGVDTKQYCCDFKYFVTLGDILQFIIFLQIQMMPHLLYINIS